jgi:replication factor C subunit 1
LKKSTDSTKETDSKGKKVASPAKVETESKEKSKSPDKKQLTLTPKKSDTTNKQESPPSRRLEYDSSPIASRRVSPRKGVPAVILQKEEPIETKRTRSPEKKPMPSKKDDFKAPTPKAVEKSSKVAKRPSKKEEDDDDEGDFNPKSKPPPKKQQVSPVKGESKSDPPPIKTPEEKKKAQMQNYSKYLAKVNAKPKNLGMKDIPEGAPNCLAGLTFVMTGVLDSLERDSCKDLIEQYGGRVTGSVSKKTTYLIVGDDPGESKTRKAKQLNVPELSEDGLLDMLRKSNPNPQPAAEPMDFDEFAKDEETPELPIEKSTSKKQDSPRKSKVPSPVKSPVAKKPKLEPVATKDESQKPVPLVPKVVPNLADPSAGLMWVDKYKPKSLKNVVGQGKDTSNAAKLLRWLKNWYNYHGSSQVI